eukprot:1522123-Prymnesium_polylepis.1
MRGSQLVNEAILFKHLCIRFLKPVLQHVCSMQPSGLSLFARRVHIFELVLRNICCATHGQLSIGHGPTFRRISGGLRALAIIVQDHSARDVPLEETPDARRRGVCLEQPAAGRCDEEAAARSRLLRRTSFSAEMMK